MKKLLLSLFLLMPVGGFAQTDFEVPDGSTIEVYLALPDVGQEPLPLAIVMGGGPGNGRVAENTFNLLGQQFVSHGWAVATPVSPNGQSFWGDNAEKVRQLIDMLKMRGNKRWLSPACGYFQWRHFRPGNCVTASTGISGSSCCAGTRYRFHLT